MQDFVPGQVNPGLTEPGDDQLHSSLQVMRTEECCGSVKPDKEVIFNVLNLSHNITMLH